MTPPIDDLEKARTRILELEAELARLHRLATVGGLVNGVAHELNNPLSSVMGFAELALNSEQVPEEVKGYLTVVSEEARRAAKIVRNLLTFARPHKPARTLAQVNDILRRVTDLLTYDLRVAKVKLVEDLEPTLPAAEIDAYQIQNVLFKLVTQALHAMTKDGSKPGTLTIATRARPGGLTISVSHTGSGVSADAVSGSTSILKAHQAKLLVEPARFELDLPLQPETKDPRILIVDDDATIVKLLAGILRDRHAVLTAGDGQAAIDLLQREKVDLVITDMKMPGLGGRELYQFIVRERPELASRVLFMTGDLLPDETRDFLTEGKCTFLEKPFHAQRVLEAVASALAG